MRYSNVATLAILAASLGGMSPPREPQLVESEPLPEPVQREKMERAERRRQAKAEKRKAQYERSQDALRNQAQSRYTRRFKP